MGYVALSSIHDPATGTVAPATWGDQIHSNLEFLVDAPRCSISAAAKTVSNNTLTVLGTSPDATENYDNDAMHSNVTNPSQITIQTAGRYLFLGAAGTSAHQGGNGMLRISLRVDGSTAYGGQSIKNFAAGPTEAVRLLLARTLVLTAGQYVEMTCQHNVGSSVDFTLDELVAQYMTR